MGLDKPSEMTGESFFPDEQLSSVPLMTANVAPGVSLELSVNVRGESA